MTGKQIFWSCALTGYIIFLAVAINTGDGIGGFCLALISGGVAVVAGFFYGLVKFLKWLGKEPESLERVIERNPRQNLRKELGKVKKQSDANTAALLQYIHDAMRDGWEEEAIRTGLLGKGWTEGQVRAAFSAYRDMLERHPLPAKGLQA